ncbi:hypothetical protein MARPO_0210s0006 [Marchantia polymorpha]|uniref:Uncharacterized protein n=1 Tax=Marchantia polymorpha TaxID=3197 RepID=A0A2R6W097_MARPO|nr:hypothetical protein MARPO_0210s0006 [Marchantia polymorpha]|eukprot:PTQ27264.1 hypothetical protein MARPO_0210s0006 [Marchantia polymorpha]
MQAFARKLKAAFLSLQGLNTIVSQQRARLQLLIETYCRMTNMQGPISPEQIVDILAEQPADTSSAFIVSHVNVKASHDGLGLWIMEQFDELDDDKLFVLIGFVGKLFVQAADGIAKIVCERNEANKATEELPPVLPHELCRIDIRQFVKHLQAHRDCLMPSFGADSIDYISKDFSDFLHAFCDEPQFKEAVLNDSIGNLDFKECWASENGRSALLQDFCGGMATAFSNTSTVVSDFFILGWEKDEYRTSLTHFSLAGILHCKPPLSCKATVLTTNKREPANCKNNRLLEPANNRIAFFEIYFQRCSKLPTVFE